MNTTNNDSFQHRSYTLSVHKAKKKSEILRMADNIGRDKVASLVSDSSGYFLFHESIENMILRMFRDITNTALKVKVLSATIIICHCTATARMSYLPESRSQINFVHQTNESSYNYLLRKSQRFLSSKRAQNQSPQPHRYGSGLKLVLGHARA